MSTKQKKSSSQTRLQKILNDSIKAARTVNKNREIIETLVSIEEINVGKYKKYSSGKEMFEALGI